MEYLLIPAACLLATAKILIQGKFAKDKSRTPVDAIFFNGLIFLTGALLLWLLLPEGTSSRPALLTITTVTDRVMTTASTQQASTMAAFFCTGDRLLRSNRFIRNMSSRSCSKR